jgi:S1-C subfamily serine protease
LPPSALALTASQVYEQVKDSVVVVKAYDQKGQQVSLGSGVMLSSGDIVTNYHVVKAGVRYMVGRQVDITKLSDAELEKIANGQPMVVGAPWIVNATLKAGDPDKDLCLLAAPGLTAKPARLGRAARLKVGEPVYAVGAPQGLELSLSEGIVSQLRGGSPPLIQTTVAISQGSSGGGLFNAEAELVGITTFYLKDGQSLNFALPVEWIGEVARGKIRDRPRVEAPEIPERGDRPKDGWADRGRPPVKTRFTKAANGVISDSATGLEWYIGPDQDTTWKDAQTWAGHLTEAGGGWRMPTIPELKALYQRGAGHHNMDPIFRATGNWVWSGELKDALSAWYLYFGDRSESPLHALERWSHLDTAGRAFAVRSRR